MSSSEWKTVVKGGVPFVIRDNKYRDTAYGFRSVGASTNGQHVRIDICPRVHILHATKESGVLTTSRATKVEWEQIAYSIDMAIMNANDEDDEIGLESTSRDEWAKAVAEDLQLSLTSQMRNICGFAEGSEGLLLWDDTPQDTISRITFFSANNFSNPPIDNVIFRMNFMDPEEMAAMVGYLSHSATNWGDVIIDNSQLSSLINAEHPSMSTKTIVIERTRPNEEPVDSAMQGVENEWQLVASHVNPDRILRIPEDLVPLRSQQQTGQSQATAEVASEAAPEDLDWEKLAAGMNNLSF